ncbi:MAG: VWA domain-containing protein, partial [Bauldia sp.]|nr:VWA domain-containing protein [Bauldia sp.]
MSAKAERLGLRLIETAPDAATTRLHVMVRQREALRASFQDGWRKIETLGSPAAVERWSAAALSLLDVHAGPGALLSLLSVTLEHGGRLGLGTMAAAGEEAAAACRHAGRRGAEGMLATLRPLVAAGREDEAAEWWRILGALAESRSDCLLSLLPVFPTLARSTDAAGLESWIASGLRATGARREEAAAWFSLTTPLSRRVLRESAGAGSFSSRERALAATFRALFGIRPIIRPREEGADGGAPPTRTTLAGGIVLVPSRPPELPEALTPLFYEAALAHIGAHAVHTGRRMRPGTLRPVQIAVVSALEDARVEALAMAAMPGLRRLWAPFHAASPRDVRSAAGLIARLSRALFDPAYADPDPWVGKGLALYAEGVGRLADPAISREIGDLLGNDLGQMRLPFNAKTYVVEPAYRDDNLGLWDFDTPEDTPPETHALVLDSVRVEERESEDPDARRKPDESGATPASASAGAMEGGVAVARYPEWDYATARLRPEWATVRESQPASASLVRLNERLAGEQALDRRIGRIVKAAAIGRSVRLKRQLEGEHLDLDAAIDAAADQRLGRSPDPRLFQRRAQLSRDLAALILLDTSESTRARAPGLRERVLDIEVVAAAMLSRAMSALGDPHAVWGFASNGRDAVEITEVKGFGETAADALPRLAALGPGLSTRLGPALRHATAALSERRALRKLLLVVTDGQPSDIDVED